MTPRQELSAKAFSRSPDLCREYKRSVCARLPVAKILRINELRRAPARVGGARNAPDAERAHDGPRFPRVGGCPPFRRRRDNDKMTLFLRRKFREFRLRHFYVSIGRSHLAEAADLLFVPRRRQWRGDAITHFFPSAISAGGVLVIAPQKWEEWLRGYGWVSAERFFHIAAEATASQTPREKSMATRRKSKTSKRTTIAPREARQTLRAEISGDNSKSRFRLVGHSLPIAGAKPKPGCQKVRATVGRRNSE